MSVDTKPPEDPAQRLNYFLARKLLAEKVECFPWYDSGWLRRYAAARDLIAAMHPEKLEIFTAAFEPLRTRPDFSVRKLGRVFDDNVLARIRETVRAVNPGRLDDPEIERFGRHVIRNNPYFAELHKQFVPLVSDLAGEGLAPSYSFLSLYKRLGVCEPHMDAPSAKWTLDICIDQDRPWPISFSQIVPWPENFSAPGDNWQGEIQRSPDLRFETFILEPGEAVFFSGSSQWHYRDPIVEATERSFCNLLFFHYIPDGLADVVSPKNWAGIFGIPELAYMLVDGR